MEGISEYTSQKPNSQTYDRCGGGGWVFGLEGVDITGDVDRVVVLSEGLYRWKSWDPV
jgi:hypothetical protein